MHGYIRPFDSSASLVQAKADEAMSLSPQVADPCLSLIRMKNHALIKIENLIFASSETITSWSYRLADYSD
jgi:hypothetical protein